MTYMAKRIQHLGDTIFSEMTNLANQHQAINLGQGFPNFPAPDFIKAAAQEAISANINQYAPARGRPRLRQALAHKMAQEHNLHIDPASEIIITHGATEAIFATILGLVNPGDEVILFEPYYDSYVPCTQIAGGIPRYYTLQPPNWHIDETQLASLFNDKTKLIVLNTPHNPTGKVFSPAELQLIADLCQKHDVIAVTDEVYEHIVFDGAQHHCLATFPGMRERTVIISSMGKTFSTTGWKVGWVITRPGLAQATLRTHQFMTFSGAAPLQEAAAVALEQAPERGYYTWLKEMYQAKRDLLIKSLHENNLSPIIPKGTYFIMADISRLGFEDDVAFCRYLTTEIGVGAIPPSAFYNAPAGGKTLARFTFCKTDDLLHQAGERLQKLQSAKAL